MPKPCLPHELNICMISKNFPLTGRAADHSYLLHIAKGLVQKGHKVTVLAHSNQVGKTEVNQDGIQCYYLNQTHIVSEDKYADLVKEKFSKLHRKEAFHIVHAIDASGAKVFKYNQAYDAQTILDIEATRIGEIFSILGMGQETAWSAIRTAISVAYKFIRTYFSSDRILLKKSRGVFVTSPQQRITLERYYLYPDRRIYTVSYGIEVNETHDKEHCMKLREKLNIQDDDFCIITFSDMVEVNEIKTILQAFEQTVIKKPNCKFIIVGNGPLKKQIELLVYKHILGSKVSMTGAVKNTEIPDYISMADVYINLSSRSSGFEPSLLESMAQKKIVIGSEVSALSTLIEDGVDGFLVRPADTLGLFQLFMDIINQQVPINDIKDHAFEKVKTFSDPKKMINNCIDAYFDVLKLSGKYKIQK